MSGDPPHQREWIASERWLRIRFGGALLADSRRVRVLRQHGFLPVYYVPEADVATELLVPSPHTSWSPYKGRAHYRDVVTGGRRAPAAAWTYPAPLPGSPDTRGHWSFHFHAMDAWYEEEERIFVHARDPHLAVQALRSRRHVTVSLAGTTVADTRRPVMLSETGLITRFYIPADDVDLRHAAPSPTLTRCPYKGVAAYLDVAVGDVVHEDVAWVYPAPLPAIEAVAGHVCFFAERDGIEITVDGERLPHLGVRPDPGGGELLTPSRAYWPVPAPTAMVGRAERQHDFARPNRRAEGPPDELIEMDVERSGGRRAELEAGLGGPLPVTGHRTLRPAEDGTRPPQDGARSARGPSPRRIAASPDAYFTSGPSVSD